jgi:uncharacterized integral membrane protein
MTDRSIDTGTGVVRRALGALLLFRLPDARLDVMATAATAALVGLSRFAYLANGPWEWDETLFARGILHFELAAHFPHPPGFPGWLAIGHLLTPVVGDPLCALQLASAAFSVAALWVLAAIGRRVAPPAVAVAAALVVLAAPGPWLYSERGFSSTTASVLALGAAAVAVGGLHGRRVSAFTLLVTASFLVRPNVLPVLAVLWLGAAWNVRPLRRLLPGLAVGTALVTVSVILMVRAEGGWSAFVAPFVVHSQRHFSRLAGNFGGFEDLGLVKGLGGVLPATVVLLAAAIGIVVWARRAGRQGAVLWTLVLTVAVSQLVWMQNRTTGRYAVGVQMAIAPLIAATASVLPPAAGCAVLLGSAGWLGVGSWPLVEEQHTTELAAWRAVTATREEALENGRTVVLEPELHPFASYLWHLMERRGEATPPWVLSPWDPGPWAGVDGSWIVATVHRHLYPDGLAGRERSWGGVSARLRPLTQGRFLEAWLIEEPPLPLEGWWPRERTPEGRPFMWGAARAELLLPPMAAGSELGLSLAPAFGLGDSLRVVLDGEVVATIDGSGGERRVWLDAPSESVDRPTRLVFKRARGYPPGGGDSRPLAVQLFEIRALSQGAPWASPVSHAWQREAMRIEVQGAYNAEYFPGIGEGAWLQPRALLQLPATVGRLRLRMWAPRPTPSRTVIRVAGRHATEPLEIGPFPADYAIEVLPGDIVDGRLEIEIRSDTYRPAEDGAADLRELGVVLSDVAFEPRDGGS